MRILVVQEADWGAKGPHQQHHLFERMQMDGHDIRIIDYESFWKKNRHAGLIARRREYIAQGKVMPDSRLHIVRPTMLRVPIFCYLSLLVFHFLEIRRQLSEFKPHVVVGWGILNSYMAAMLSSRHRIPFVYYVIDSLHTLIPEKTFRMLGKLLESRIARHADRVLVINKGLGDYVHSLGARRSVIDEISAGVDLDRMNPNLRSDIIRSKYGIEQTDIVLFYMGNMFPFSGLKEVAEDLLERPDATHVKLLLLGRGELYDPLKEMNQDIRSMNRIILVNWVKYEEVPSYIAAASFALLPAHLNDVMRNIVPIKTYEYLACGKPLIATRLPGILKEFGNGNGVVYVESPRDVIGLALELEKNPDIIEQMQRNAVGFVAPLSWPELTERFYRALKESISQKSN